MWVGLTSWINYSGYFFFVDACYSLDGSTFGLKHLLDWSMGLREKLLVGLGFPRLSYLLAGSGRFAVEVAEPILSP